ncbi:MAG: DUF4157 domain-containing protein [Chitinophagaceae bacterium]|nr:DUF4157 domain-containing protein [Chitinophagaceae bacterium]
MIKQIPVRVQENSRLAAMAAWKLGVPKCAMVIGRTIYLYRARKQDLLDDTAWLRHEVAHIHQWEKMGWSKFILQYLWLSFRHGYWENPLEAEARKAEQNPDILKSVEIL